MALKVTESEENNESNVDKTNIVEITPEIQKLIAAEVAKLSPTSSDGDKSSSDKNLEQLLIQSLLDNKKDEVYDEFSFNSNKNIDADDLLDEPVVFFAPKYRFALGADRKNGKQMAPPNGVILFKYMHTIRKQSGKDINIQQWCKHVCKSKVELEFLKGHTVFGSLFYEKASDIIQSEDMQLVNSIIKKSASLSSLGSHDILRLMKDNGLEITTDDVSVQKTALAAFLAKQELSKIKGEFSLKISDDMKSKKLLNLKD